MTLEQHAEQVGQTIMNHLRANGCLSNYGIASERESIAEIVRQLGPFALLAQQLKADAPTRKNWRYEFAIRIYAHGINGDVSVQEGVEMAVTQADALLAALEAPRG